MKKTYIEPECEIVTFSSEDVITTSGLKGVTDDPQTAFELYGAEYFQ